MAPVDEAPAFEFVPDDMYDGYQDISADGPADGYGAPWDEPAPAEAQPAVPAPAAQPAAPVPGATFGSPAQPAPGEDSTAWLSQLLEAGFGQPVKVTRE